MHPPFPQRYQKNRLGIFQCAHPFLLVSFSHCPPSRLLKQAHRCPISGGSLSSYAQSIAHHFFAFIRLTISREWWRHYAIGCNTITSLSHFSVVAKAGTVSSSSRFNCPLRREARGRRTVASFLCQATKSHTRAVWPPLIISCPLVLRVQDEIMAECWRRMRMIDSQLPSHRNSLGFLKASGHAHAAPASFLLWSSF